MKRLVVGCGLVACAVLACGESSRHANGSAGAGMGSSQGASGGSEPSGGGSLSASGASGVSEAGGGSGSASEVDAYFEPGSRLKPRLFAPEGSVAILRDVVLDASWHDSKLGFDCLFLPDEAGTERCFPRQFPSGSAFADAACSQRVLLDTTAGTCAALRGNHVVVDEGSCTMRGFRIGKELPSSTQLFYSDGSSCRPSTQDGSIPIYELEALPAETFVAMQRVQRARAPGLDAYVREGDDGSWQIIGYFDPARQAACFELASFGPASKCVPAFANALHFADATCRTHAGSVQTASCRVEQPAVLMTAQVDADSCPPTRSFELFEIDSVQETSLHELDQTGACVKSKLAPQESYVQGAAISASTLPTLETLVVGAGAARGVFSGFGGIPYVPLGYAHPGLVDATGEACGPFHFPDGSLRCVPQTFAHATPAVVVYEDAACGGPPVVPWVAKPTCPVDPPLPAAVGFVDPTACVLAVTELLAVVGESKADSLYTKDPTTGACQAAARSPSVTYLVLGAVMDSTALPDLKPTLGE